VAISECEAGSAEESSPEGDLLLWPRPMRKGAGDMPGISNVARVGGWVAAVETVRTKARVCKGSEAQRAKKDGARSQLLIVKAKARQQATLGSRRLQVKRGNLRLRKQVQKIRVCLFRTVRPCGWPSDTRRLSVKADSAQAVDTSAGSALACLYMRARRK
jgi:hypothetical protein